MTTVSILGRGTMGSAIASVVEKGGNSVQLLGSKDGASPVTGEVVVLALPYPAMREALEQRRGQLDGKVVVDITNPVDFETFSTLTVPADLSATAVLAAALPQSRVVKAFNTIFAATLTTESEGTTVLIAGDDTDAKSQVADLVTAAGLRALDVGALERARELEAVGLLQITLAVAGKIPWSGGFTIRT